jgi:hypothetical protein
MSELLSYLQNNEPQFRKFVPLYLPSFPLLPRLALLLSKRWYELLTEIKQEPPSKPLLRLLRPIYHKSRRLYRESIRLAHSPVTRCSRGRDPLHLFPHHLLNPPNFVTHPQPPLLHSGESIRERVRDQRMGPTAWIKRCGQRCTE